MIFLATPVVVVAVEVIVCPWAGRSVEPSTTTLSVLALASGIRTRISMRWTLAVIGTGLEVLYLKN